MGFDDGGDEVPLLGGDVTEGLVRVGETVRRPAAAWSPAIAALLGELEAGGFDRVPRHLGVDERGRHVLSFIEGDVASRPWPSWVAEDDAAVSVAQLVRAYDDAAVEIGVPAWSRGLVVPDAPGAPPMVSGPPDFVAHMDITPENVIFRNGRAHALIDFDLARPATRVEEVCNLLVWWGAWMPVPDLEPVMRPVDPAARGRLIVDGYGLDATARADVVTVARNQADRSWHTMKHRSESIGGGWRRMWDEGVGDKILRRQEWLADRADDLHAALVR